MAKYSTYYSCRSRKWASYKNHRIWCCRIRGGPKGDLYITFTIDNHTAFKRDKENLYASVDLDLYKAILGGDITIDTFDGKVKLNVPAGTQNGTKVKLKGKGFVYKKGRSIWDLYITYEIKILISLSEKKNYSLNFLH
jgi:curved DNA-binding protein